jgi:hypothetical protein
MRNMLSPLNGMLSEKVKPIKDKYNDALHLWIILTFVFLKLLLHLMSNSIFAYGIFRDEFYYLACASHPDIGYVDQPPLSIWILTVYRALFGDSLFVIRLLPALLGALTVYLTGRIVLELKGGAIALILTSIATTLSPILLSMNNLYSMNSIDIFLWALGAWIFLKLIQTHETKYWIIMGVVIGLGLLNKISMAWFAIGFGLAILLTDLRISLKTRWPYFTALIALLCFSPFIIWNIQHDFAHLEFMANATKWKYSGMNPVIFLKEQFLLLLPLGFIIWLLGIFGLFWKKEWQSYRPIAIIGLTTLIILLINWHSKPEYLSPTIPMIMAGGALFVARYVKKWIAIALMVLMATGIFVVPLAIPMLPVETFIAYNQTLGLTPTNTESKELSALPQHYADMFGWEEMAQQISNAYEPLPDSMKTGAVIAVQNYGEAAALEYYQKKYPLPPVICPHNNYWLWGWQYADKPLETVFILGGRIEDHVDDFESVEAIGTIRCRYCMPYENNQILFLCKTFKNDFKKVWKEEKHFI